MSLDFRPQLYSAMIAEISSLLVSLGDILILLRFESAGQNVWTFIAQYGNSRELDNTCETIQILFASGLGVCTAQVYGCRVGYAARCTMQKKNSPQPLAYRVLAYGPITHLCLSCARSETNISAGTVQYFIITVLINI